MCNIDELEGGEVGSSNDRPSVLSATSVSFLFSRCLVLCMKHSFGSRMSAHAGVFYPDRPHLICFVANRKATGNPAPMVASRYANRTYSNESRNVPSCIAYKNTRAERPYSSSQRDDLARAAKEYGLAALELWRVSSHLKHRWLSCLGVHPFPLSFAANAVVHHEVPQSFARVLNASPGLSRWSRLSSQRRWK